MSNIEMIRAAEARLSPVVRRTPLLTSPFLDEIAGRKLFVKAECLQHTGSFKFRGAFAALSALDPDVRAKGVLAFSSGNHAQGVALAARMHGCASVIIMPADAPKLKIDNTRALGAEVLLYDRAAGQSREQLGESLQTERGLTLIRPYDEPLVIAGQGTVGLEIAEQTTAAGIEEAEVLVCCGGGGLSSGISLALADQATGLRVRTAEPEGFDDVKRSLAAGTRVPNNAPSGSLCDAILTPEPGEITFPILQKHCGAGLAVADDECLQAMALAFLRLKIVLEPGGAAALAAALFRKDELKCDAVVAVATGGNVDAGVFAMALERYGDI